MHGCLKLLVVNWLGLIVLQLGLGLGLGLGQVMDITFSPYLKVTNTFVYRSNLKGSKLKIFLEEHAPRPP